LVPINERFVETFTKGLKSLAGPDLRGFQRRQLAETRTDGTLAGFFGPHTGG
jgi:hypothetical protein